MTSAKTEDDATNAGPPPFDPERVAAMDLIRFFAVNIVVFAHLAAILAPNLGSDLINPGALGVMIFFPLSGFLIASTGLRNARRGAGFWDFFIDRSARIMVPFVPALVLAVIANAIWLDESWGQEGVSEGVIAFLANLFMLGDHAVFQAASFAAPGDMASTIEASRIRAYNGVEPHWTIPIEYWTYMVFGLFLFVWQRGEQVSKTAIGVILVVGMPVFLWNAFAGGGNVLSLLWVAGALFGYAWAYRLNGDHSLCRIGLALGVLGVIGLGARIADDGELGYTLHQGLFVTMIVCGAILAAPVVGRLLRMVKGAAAFGASYSYSLYLIHNLVLVTLAESGVLKGESAVTIVVVGFGLSHVAAWVMAQFTERYDRRIRKALKEKLAQVRRDGGLGLRGRSQDIDAVSAS